ncbi:hypothetical protein ACIQU6_32365 [Streptomyces sp. NPDC090442]|uniref:hypothetical protein n=1 Tax=Streptomyces sp. NPDC090442 TaxID=3365962 RepID=UPI00380D0439
MPHTIRTIFETLLGLLLPSQGRHRSDDTPPAPEHPDTPTLTIPHVPANERPLRGEDVAFVRPYVLAHQGHQERRLQRSRRRALWLAAYGIDTGPRWIHGVEVGC